MGADPFAVDLSTAVACADKKNFVGFFRHDGNYYIRGAFLTHSLKTRIELKKSDAPAFNSPVESRKIFAYSGAIFFV
jgi:hypothetical protein